MNDIKSICHVSTVHPNSDPRIYYKQVLTLASAGYEVYYITPKEAEIETPPNVHCLYLPRPTGLFSRLKNLLISFKLVLRSRAPIFHFHDPELLLSGVILKIFWRKKVIFDIHELTFDAILYKEYLHPLIRKPISIFYKFLEMGCIKIFDHIILAEACYSDYYNTNKKTIIQNYIPAKFVLERPPESIPRKTVELVYIGSVTNLRGINEMIELANLLQGKIDFRIQIIGEFESSELREKIETQLSDLDLSARVILHGKKLFTKGHEIVEQCQVGLLFMHPIENNLTSLPTKIYEYMSKGLAIIMSDFPNYTEFNSEYGSGLNVDIFNLENSVDNIIKFLTDEAGLNSIGKANIINVRDNFIWESQEKELLDVYRKMLD